MRPFVLSLTFVAVSLAQVRSAQGTPETALLTCASSMSESSAPREAGAVQVPDLFRSYARSCAKLHRARACRAAWQRAAEAQGEERIRLLTAGCVPAYCPSLKAPRPALCTVGKTSAAQLWELWRELYPAILAQDLETDSARPEIRKLGDLLFGHQQILVALPAGPRVSVRTITLRLQRDGSGIQVTMDGQRSWHVPADPTDRDLAPVLNSGALTDAQVVIRSEPALHRGFVPRLLDALKNAGCTRFALELEK